MTLVLLDTNAYLRLAKRIKPMLGIKFGQKEYVLTILPEVEQEVRRSARLQNNFPWFSHADFATERLSKQYRLSKSEKAELDAAASILHGWVLLNAANYKTPPSPVDCRVLAFGQVREAIVVTDDLSMHQLTREFDISVLHGYELLKKMLTAKMVAKSQVQDIYAALQANGDLPKTWQTAKEKVFGRLFQDKGEAT